MTAAAAATCCSSRTPLSGISLVPREDEVQGRPRRAGPGCPQARRRRGDRRARRSRRHAGLRCRGRPDRRPRSAGLACRARARRQRRPRQRALRDADPTGAALRRGGGAAGRGGGGAQAEAAGGRRDGRPPERRQVLAPSPHLEREAKGGGLSVHDARARARHRRVAGRRPAHRRRRPRPDRGRQRGDRARTRIPRPSRARPAAPARDRCVGRGRRGALPHDRQRACALRRRPGRAAAGDRAEQDRPSARASRSSRSRTSGSSASSPSRARPARGSKTSSSRSSGSVPPHRSRGPTTRPRYRSSSNTGRSRRRAARTGSIAPTGASAIIGDAPQGEELEAVLKAAGARKGHDVEIGEETLEWQ